MYQISDFIMDKLYDNVLCEINDLFMDKLDFYVAYTINDFLMDKVFVQAITEMTTTLQV